MQTTVCATLYTVYIDLVGKVNVCVTVYLSEYKNNILKYFTTHLGMYCVVSVTLYNKKAL